MPTYKPFQPQRDRREADDPEAMPTNTTSLNTGNSTDNSPHSSSAAGTTIIGSVATLLVAAALVLVA